MNQEQIEGLQRKIAHALKGVAGIESVKAQSLSEDENAEIEFDYYTGEDGEPVQFTVTLEED